MKERVIFFLLMFTSTFLILSIMFEAGFRDQTRINVRKVKSEIKKAGLVPHKAMYYKKIK